MENTGTIPSASYRSKLTDLMKSRYPDRNYEAQGDQPATHDLDESLYETYNSMNDKIGRYEEDRERLRSTMKLDGRNAKFFNRFAETGSGARAFGETWGVDALKKLGTPEGAQLIADLEAEEAREKAESEAFKEEFKQNFKASIDGLKAWGESKGLNEDQQMEFLTKLLDVLQDAEEGKYSNELFDAVWKSRNYDADVESARNEGLVTGRNERIQQSSLRREAAQQMPPTLSGRATQVQEQPSRASKWGDYLK